MTFLETVNEVLRRLREDTVSTVSESAYATLVGSFVKQAAEEISNAYAWPQLASGTETEATVSGTGTVQLGGADETSMGNIEFISVYNVTNDCYLSPMSVSDVLSKQDSDDDTNQPMYYADQGNTSIQGRTIYLWPIPDGVYSLKFRWYKKYSQDGTYNDGTAIFLPTLPVVLRALAIAISERGEDGGALSSEADIMAMNALGDAIALHESNNYYNNLSWDVV